MEELLLYIGLMCFFLSSQYHLDREENENASLQKENQLPKQELNLLEATHRRNEAQRHFKRMCLYYRRAEEAFQLGNFNEDLFYEARRNYLEAKNYYESIKKIL